jgi:hypothetical protein
MRWKSGEVQKRHVPEPERLREKAANLKGKADKLLREADVLLAAAEALEVSSATSRDLPPNPVG